MSLQLKIKEAVELRSSKQPEKAMEVLKSVAPQAATNDANWNYQVAWTYDTMGQEGAAAPHYEAALANGLTEDREGAYLGLGSTYRCLGEYRKSIETFDRAVKEFPDNRGLAVFRALTLYNLGKSADAVGVLLTQLLDTTNDGGIKKYDRALRFYADKLGETWT